MMYPVTWHVMAYMEATASAHQQVICPETVRLSDHAWAALKGAVCVHCELLALRVLHSHLAMFNMAGQALSTHQPALTLTIPTQKPAMRLLSTRT